jgi:hypothetical protein
MRTLARRPVTTNMNAMITANATSSKHLRDTHEGDQDRDETAELEAGEPAETT